MKSEREKWNQEREEMKMQIQKVIGKETQYRHEIRSKETIIQKLQDQLNKKILEKNGKQQQTGTIEVVAHAL
jgi:hypothetical protein